jgi:hypothetical protein
VRLVVRIARGARHRPALRVGRRSAAAACWLSGSTTMSGVVRLRFRLGVRLGFRQRSRLRFPAAWVRLGGFPCIRGRFSGGCGGDISMSAGECPVSRLLTGDRLAVAVGPVGDGGVLLPWAAFRGAVAARSGRRLLVRWLGRVSLACRVVASRRCLGARARLVVLVGAFSAGVAVAGLGCTVRLSLSRRLAGRWGYGWRAARRRAGGGSR